MHKEVKTRIIADPGKQEVIITRVFDAPRELVFEVYTSPVHLPNWRGPKTLTTVVDIMEVKPGGMWRFVQYDAGGMEHGFHGVYHDVIQPKRIVNTFEYEGVPGHVILETTTFEDYEGKTKLTNRAVFQSTEDRNGMLKSGMESGARESMERLAELLDKLI